MPSRYVCEVLTEIRECTKTLRFDRLPGLIEEVQTLVNRMEARLNDYSSMKYDLQRARELKQRIAQLKSTEQFLEANLKLPEFDGNEDEDIFDEVMN
jgi:hypothetical protein